MATRTRPVVTDAGLQAIADLRAAIVAAHDEQVQHGVSADEVARQRPAIVALAAAVADRLRAEYRARTRT